MQSDRCASAAVLLWLESGAMTAPRDALQQIADEVGSSDALAAITEARERGTIPAIGAASALKSAIELATQMAARTGRLRV